MPASQPDTSPFSAAGTSVVGPSVTPGSNNGNDKSSLQEKKSKRIQLSCTSCRHRKLKCNRLQPCENCIKRGQAQTCHYANPGPKKTQAQARLSARNNELQQRLLHLEELVVNLQSRNEGTQDSVAAMLVSQGSASRRNERVVQSGDEHPGRMVTDKLGTRYVDAVHWQAMLDEITQVKEHLATEGDDDDTPDYQELADNPGAPLLFGFVQTATKSDLLGGIPSKHICDQLVKRWIRVKEPCLLCIHVPTFMNEYEKFWKDPRSAPSAFISLLFSIIWLGANFYIRTGEQPPSDRAADIESQMEAYLTKSVQALILSDYKRPGKYKLEALLHYFNAEFLRYHDMQIGISFLISVIVRMAMVSGFHRDPKHFPDLSAFDGEMRRRVWLLVLQLDTLIAFQVGLPRAIHDWQCDTIPPRNLQDEDLHPGIKHLPAGRPETERTPVTYQMVKSRIMAVFGTISDRAYSRERMTYDEIMLLDMRLREAYDSIPTFLKGRPINLSHDDPPEVIMQRYNLFFVYNKGRIILHRRCFSGAITDPRCIYSKRICVESAMMILKKQKEIHHATRLNGVLRHDSWYLSSLTTHDFIMAAMILCLWLSREQQRDRSANHDSNDTAAHNLDALEALRAQPNSAELFGTLDDSYKIWLSMKAASYEAYKASQALAVMLGKTRARADKPAADRNDGISRDFAARMDVGGAGPGLGPGSGPVPVPVGGINNNPASAGAGIAAPLVAAGPGLAGVPSPASSGSAQHSAASQHSESPHQQGETPESDMNADDSVEYDFNGFDPSTFAAVSENLMDAPLDLDWDSWDMQYIQGKGVDANGQQHDPTGMDWINDPSLQNIDLQNFPHF